MATAGEILLGENISERYFTFGQAVLSGACFLAEAGIESPRLDAEVLLRHVLRLGREQLYLRAESRLGEEERVRFRLALRQRSQHEPVAYITGRKEFWSLEFRVTPAVLIPRPETEVVVEVALKSARRLEVKSGLKILEVGTGSGVIAVSLAKELAYAEISATEVSEAALEVACENAARHGVSRRIRFLEGDVFSPVSEKKEFFHLVVSNPPYVRSSDLGLLPREIRNWEPAVALEGGIDGLDYYRRIISEAHRHLVVGGYLVLEIGEDMACDVSRLFAEAGCYAAVSICQDYGGRNRVISGRKVVPGNKRRLRGSRGG